MMGEAPSRKPVLIGCLKACADLALKRKILGDESMKCQKWTDAMQMYSAATSFLCASKSRSFAGSAE